MALVDIILIALIALFGIFGIGKGFSKGLASLLGGALSFIWAIALTFLLAPVVLGVDAIMDLLGPEGSLTETVDGIFKMDLASVNSILYDKANFLGDKQFIGDSISGLLFYLVYFLIGMVLFAIVLKIIVWFFNNLAESTFTVKNIRYFGRFLGFILGAVKGAILGVIVIALLAVVGGFVGEGTEFFDGMYKKDGGDGDVGIVGGLVRNTLELDGTLNDLFSDTIGGFLDGFKDYRPF